MNDRLHSHAPHLHNADWQRPMSTDAAWLILLVVACVGSGLAGWLLRGLL